MTELTQQLLWEAGVGIGGPAWARQRVARIAAGCYAAPAPLDRAADGALCDMLEHPWDNGWQPVDIWQIVRRRLGDEAAEFAVGAIAANSARYAESTLAPRWRAQLVELGAVIWWDRSQPYVAQWAHRADQDVLIVMELVFQLLWLLRRLPSEPKLIPRPGSAIGAPGAGESTPRTGAVDPKVLSKVRALLAKAESTQFVEEADAFFAKAQELMSRYSLERAALDALDDGGGPSAVRTSGRRIWLDNPYLRPKSVLVHAVAQANRCRSVYTKFGFLTVVGEDTDTEIVEVLSTSLLVQAGKAMLAAGSHVDWRGQSRTKSFRQSFLLSYAKRIGERLREAAVHAESEVTSSLGDGRLLPVLAARERAVEQHFRDMFPRVRGSRTVAASNSAGWTAGRAAADLAVLDVRRAVRG